MNDAVSHAAITQSPVVTAAITATIVRPTAIADGGGAEKLIKARRAATPSSTAKTRPQIASHQSMGFRIGECSARTAPKACRIGAF